MSFEVQTRVFEGPLDLLLQLITSHQLEITDLSLSSIVTEFVAHLDAITDTDMESTSEFLLIAATLIQLKARHLLPDGRPLDLDEELELAGERDKLLSRLLACLTFKDVAAVLLHRLEAVERWVARDVGLDPGIEPARANVRLGVSLDEFHAIASLAFSERLVDPDLDHLDFDVPSVDEAITDLRRRIASEAILEFDAVVEHCERSIEVVAYFLALLELVQWGLVHATQEVTASPITFERNTSTMLIGVIDVFGETSEWQTN
ncbi:MAG: segregation/condensation protein A [Acidobacteria bacterium]|nr:segregation/condensation protein A [Acidobacteriota bacterium]MCH8986109.1 segregation/condensation protein A [Acidobacteriota bacterium]